MFTLIDLPFEITALEPVISARTLEFHHGKHLLGYVNNLNGLLPGSKYEGLELEEIVRTAEGAVFNNAGQILNHNLYFTQFQEMPDQVGHDNSQVGHDNPQVGHDNPQVGHDNPQGALEKQIVKQWGSVEDFQTEFVAKGVGLFGSGWVWLSAKPDGELVITQEAGAGNPAAKGLKPLLTFDVWEHAYYLDYQNRRADHLKALWPLVNWSVVEERYKK